MYPHFTLADKATIFAEYKRKNRIQNKHSFEHIKKRLFQAFIKQKGAAFVSQLSIEEKEAVFV